MKDIIEIIDTKDTRLTDDFINEVRFFGSKDGYTYKDYLYISEIWHADRLVAKIYNRESKRYKDFENVLVSVGLKLLRHVYPEREDFDSSDDYYEYLLSATNADSDFADLWLIEDGWAIRWALYNIAYC